MSQADIAPEPRSERTQQYDWQDETGIVDPLTTAARKRLALFLAAVFALAMIMGTGPGVLLVNRPAMVFGLPLVYAWGILWYLVQVAVVIAAYQLVWRDPNGPE